MTNEAGSPSESGGPERPRFHIGMRNVKTSLSVFLCLLLYYVIGREGASLACTSAIICMQDSIEKSVISGRNRLIGTAFGALLGMCLLYLNLYFAPVVNLSLITATIGIMLFILLCNAIKNPDAIVIGCVVLLAIVLQQNEISPFRYSIDRLVDTFVGILVSIVVNFFIRNPLAREEDVEEKIILDPPLPPITPKDSDAIDSDVPPEDPGESHTPNETDNKQEGMD